MSHLLFFMYWTKTQDSPPISSQRRVFEIIAVTLTGLGKVVFMDMLNWRLPFIVAEFCRGRPTSYTDPVTCQAHSDIGIPEG